MQIVLTNPGTGPHVQQVGRAFFEAGMLLRLVTTLTARPESGWQSGMCRIARMIGFDLKRQLERRRIREVPLSLVRDYPWPEIVRIAVGRLNGKGPLEDVVFDWSNSVFDRWVGATALEKADAVYGYEYSCLATFQSAQRQGIRRIYDVPAPHHDFVQNILEKEIGLYPELRTPYQKHIKLRQQRRTERRRQEWELADMVIANSKFTKSSYEAHGWDVSKVCVMPLGAPPGDGGGLEGGTMGQGPLRFLSAGTFSIRKGAHHLLNAWRHFKSGNLAQLDVYGSVELPRQCLQGLPDSIHFYGGIPHGELAIRYRQADVLVFPTLCDGFGMVVTEGFAQGLPVIATDCAGAAELVKHRSNGLIVPAGNVEALTEALDWCMNHRQELRAMRKSALDTVAGWQWADYRRVLVKNILQVLEPKYSGN